MEWIVEKQLVSPTTGTFFALASDTNNTKVIIWYKGSYFIRSGNIIKTGCFGIVINGKARNIEVMHTFPFNHTVWNTFTSTISCPGNEGVIRCESTCSDRCLFDICPYGNKPLLEITG